MKILVVGSMGRFGSSVKSLFLKNGHDVDGIDMEHDKPKFSSRYDACVLAIPVEGVESYIDKLAGNPIIEVSSVKSPLLSLKGKVISVHPMFGPKSIDNPDFQNILYIEDLSAEGGEKLIRALFPGFRLYGMTAREHDEVMAELLVRPYIYSLLASLEPMQEYPFSGWSHNLFKQLQELHSTESRRVLMDTIMLNPNTPSIIKSIELGLEELRQALLTKEGEKDRGEAI